MPDYPKIGYAGLGDIGLPLAINLAEYVKLNNLPPLAVWDKLKGKYAKIHGSVGVDKLEDLQKGCDILFINLPTDDPDDHCNVLFGRTGRSAKKGIIIVDQSKLHPAIVSKCDQSHLLLSNSRS